MFDNLLQLIKENAGEAIINNPAIPNEKNDAAISVAGEGIMDQLKGMMSGGGAQNLMEIFQSGNAGSHPAVGQIGNNVAQSLMNKFGIDAGQATGIVQSLIPTVMNKLVHKTNDPNDSSFDLQGIMSSLGGGGGIMDNLKKMF
jgi:hypothetical protein